MGGEVDDEPVVRKSKKPEPTRSGSQPLHPYIRAGIIIAFAAFLLWHVFYDATHPDYEGLSTSLMFGGIVGAALSINEVLGRRDK